ncbi:MAG: hypothetical protein EOO75_20600, partial [Myxococcales bacterium]
RDARPRRPPARHTSDHGAGGCGTLARVRTSSSLAALLVTLATAREAAAAEPIRTLDLRPLYGAVPASLEERRQVYDTLTAAACVQGLANRDGANLYLFYTLSVVQAGLDTDQLWFDRLADPVVGGAVRTGRAVESLGSLSEAIAAYQPRIKGLAVWDEKVPATVNAAFAAAGAEDLLVVRYDASPTSLYAQLSAQLPVVRWLVNQDGSSRFLDQQGQGKVPDTQRQTSQSAKVDAHVWVVENLLKAGKLNPTEFGYMLDAFWLARPQDYTGNPQPTHQLQIVNRDWLVARRGTPFDLSPWSDVAATDDPGQPVGSDPALLTELIAGARALTDDLITVRGFFGWQFKYTTLERLPA